MTALRAFLSAEPGFEGDADLAAGKLLLSNHPGGHLRRRGAS